MPKNKDLKRLVRTRMKKTGESYTAARARLVKAPRAAGPPRAEWAELAGQTDAVMKSKTGRTWAEWLSYLDERDARSKRHGEIATLALEAGVSAWWSQSVAVGYERIRGLRGRYQRSSGEYEASKSRTFPVSVATLHAAFAKKPAREAWLGSDVIVRASIPKKSVRMTWPDKTSVEAYFTAKGPQKSTVSIAHRKLKSAGAVVEAKKAWTAHLSALAEWLASKR